jgi:phage tail-like protein
MSSLDVSASASIGAGGAGIGISAGIGTGGGPAGPQLETETQFLFAAFNFAVEIDVPGISGKVCNAAFSECDGLELTHDVKTIREGGNNRAQIRLTGPASFGTVTLKRGMTPNFHLWQWFDALVANPALRAHGEIVIFTRAWRESGREERARFLLEKCVPVKLKAPPLNARDGMVAIEELQLACESITLKRASGA